MKKIKYFVLALILPVMLVFSACGGGQLSVKAEANIGNLNDYSATTVSDVETFLEAQTTNKKVNAYRMTVDVFSGAMKMNGIIKETESGMEMAMEFSMSMFDISESGKIYVKDNVIYAEYDSATAEKMGFPSNKVKATMNNDADLNATQFGNFKQYDADALISNVESWLGKGNVGVTVNTEDENIVRYQITMVDEDIIVDDQPSVSKTFIVFENNQLISIKDTSDLHTAIIQEFNGEIEFPDFSSFKEISIEEFNGDGGFGY